MAILQLSRWGISVEGDLVYRALLCTRRSTTTGLSKELGMARQRVAEALDELCSNEVVTCHRGGNAQVWLPEPPAAVLEKLRARKRRPVNVEDAWRRHQTSLTGSLLERAVTLSDEMRFLPDRTLVAQRLAELAPVQRHDHLVMNSERHVEPETLARAKPITAFTLRKGVEMRVLGLSPTEQDEAGAHETDPRQEYRVIQNVPMKLFVLDRRVALFPVSPHDFNRGYLEVWAPSIVDSLVATFQEQWARSTDLKDFHMSAVALDPRERDLLQLLAAGHTDAVAAKRLHISTRTVTNILRDLMDRFGVDNRFQLGLALGSRGYTPPTARNHPSSAQKGNS